MPEAQRCPNCGREMPAHAPHGLCPACLLGGALDIHDERHSIHEELKSAAGAAGDSARTPLGAPTETERADTPIPSEKSGPSTETANTANFAPSDGPPK
jgi:hypothetical protein